MRNKIKRFSALMAATAFVAVSLLTPLSVSAVPIGGDNDPDKIQTPTGEGTQSIKTTVNDCQVPYGQLNSSNCGIIKYIVMLTNILSALVGVVIVISITWAGIQYSTSRSDPQVVVAARQRITNGILALVIYIFMVAFLQWVVPGGVF